MATRPVDGEMIDGVECGECGRPVVRKRRGEKWYQVCSDALAADPGCFWYVPDVELEQRLKDEQAERRREREELEKLAFGCER